MPHAFKLNCWLAFPLTLKTEAKYSPETPVDLQRTTQYYNLQDISLQYKPNLRTVEYFLYFLTNFFLTNIIFFGHYPSSYLYLKCSPVSLSKHNVSETGFCLHLQVKPIQLGPIDRATPYLRTSVTLCLSAQPYNLHATQILSMAYTEGIAYIKTRRRGFSLQANYTHRATATYRRSKCQIFGKRISRGQRNGSPRLLISIF
jgi:hypothetical protein